MQGVVETFDVHLLTHVFSIRKLYNMFCKILSVLEEGTFLETSSTAVLTLMFSVELVPRNRWRLCFSFTFLH